MTPDEIRKQTAAFLNALLSDTIVKNRPDMVSWACHTSMRFATDIGAPRWLVFDMWKRLEATLQVKDQTGRMIKVNLA